MASDRQRKAMSQASLCYCWCDQHENHAKCSSLGEGRRICHDLAKHDVPMTGSLGGGCVYIWVSY